MYAELTFERWFVARDTHIPFALDDLARCSHASSRPAWPSLSLCTDRLPVSTETWHLLQLRRQWETNTNTAPPGRVFAANPVAKATAITGVETKWAKNADDNWVQTTTEHAFTVAAVTYQITMQTNAAAIKAQDKLEHPECETPDSGPGCWNVLCEKASDLATCPAVCGMYGGSCHTFHSYLQTFQRLRLPNSADGKPGAIVAEVVAEVGDELKGTWANYEYRNVTYLIQCVTTAGDATSAKSAFESTDTVTTPACGLTVGSWMRGPEDTGGHVGNSEQNKIYGVVQSIDMAEAVMVTSTTALADNYYSLKIKESIPGVGASGEITVNTTLTGEGIEVHKWRSITGRVLAQPAADSLCNFTIKKNVPASQSVDNLKCLSNCIDSALIGTTASPPKNRNIVHHYGVCETRYEYSTDGTSTTTQECNNPEMWKAVSVNTNQKFDVFNWKAGVGLTKCSGGSELGSGEVTYQDDACTSAVAVPANTPCSETAYGYCDQWTVVMTLFKDATGDTFTCSSTDSTSGGTTSSASATAKACLTVQGEGGAFVANVEDLSEYYEYHTGVASEWNSQETLWLQSEADGTQLTIEPPLQLTLEVPTTSPPVSISGASYAGKKLVFSFSDGIDEHNSPGLPMYCLNKQTGKTKAPLVDKWGHTMCMNWTALDPILSDPENNFDWRTEMYDMFPDVSPELHWEGNDAQGRKWGIKPAEKLVVYPRIEDGKCSDPVQNPIEVMDEGEVEGKLDSSSGKMRDSVAPLVEWYEANKNKKESLRVHTGTFINATAKGAARRSREL